MNRLWLHAIEDERMSGVYNATAPNAVTNAAFMHEMRNVLHRPWSPPMPAFLVPIGCFFLRTEPVLALTGRRGIPARLMEEGFEFHHGGLPEALHDLFAK
jgi:NAD dependent epimerase/dehydratase family enzyme